VRRMQQGLRRLTALAPGCRPPASGVHQCLRVLEGSVHVSEENFKVRSAFSFLFSCMNVAVNGRRSDSQHSSGHTLEDPPSLVCNHPNGLS
jgi:hypothetical protein